MLSDGPVPPSKWGHVRGESQDCILESNTEAFNTNVWISELEGDTASNFAVSLIPRQTCSSAAIISPHCEEARKANDHHLSLPLISRARRALQVWVPYTSSARNYLLPDLDVARVREPPPLAYYLPTQSSRGEMRPFPADWSDLFLNCLFACRF